MHPLVEQCLRDMDSPDPESLLSIIDRFRPDEPSTRERLTLAAKLLDAKRWQAVETIYWHILCLTGAHFPGVEEFGRVRENLSRFPCDYGVSYRLVSLAGILSELPETLHPLFRFGERPPGRMIRRLRSRPLVADLVRIVENRLFYPKDSPGRGWSPIHAIRLLGEIRAPEGIGPMLRGMLDPEIFDYALRELAFALGGMGGPVLEPTIAAMATPGLDEFQIITMGRILRDAAIVDDSSRPQVGRELLDRARDDAQPPEVRAFFLRYLIDLEAREHADAVEALLSHSFFSRGVAVPATRLAEDLRRLRAGESGVEQRRQAIASRFSSLYADEG